MKDQKRGKEFDRMMVESVRSSYSFFAWQSIGGAVEKCELRVKAYRKDYNEIELETRIEKDPSLAKVISGTRVLNIYVPELSVSFSAELKVVAGEQKLKIYLPMEYSFYERRKHERLQPEKACYVSFEANRGLMKRAIFDISLGGFAIVLPKSDKVTVAKGKEFPIMVLDIYERKIKVKAECTNSLSIDRFKLDTLPYGGYKIAFRFIEISASDREFLIDFVTHQSLKQRLKKVD